MVVGLHRGETSHLSTGALYETRWREQALSYSAPYLKRETELKNKKKKKKKKNTLELGHQPTNGGSTNLHLVLNSLIDNARLTYPSLQFGLCKRGRLKPW